MAKTANTLRVRILSPQPGPAFHADVGEERTVMKAHGQQLIAAGHAELVKAASATDAPSPAARKARKPAAKAPAPAKPASRKR